MKSVMIFWVYSAGQYATSVPLCEVAEHAARHGFNDEPMTVLCLHGYEFVPAADRARLREQNFILEDVAPLFQKIAARYPNLRKRYANHFFECFLRWIVLKEWSGNTPVLAWDADIFFNEKLSRLHAEFAGSTFTSSSTCFAALHDPRWLETYEQQLNLLERNPEAFLFDVFSKLNRLKVGGRHDFTASFFGVKIERSLNSLADWTRLFDSTPEEMFVDYLVRQELLPCHLAKGQSEFLLCPQPLLLPQLAWHHPLPPGFAVKASGDSPRALSRTDCRYHVDGQQLAFLHFQGALFRACVTHQVFHHMLGNPIPVHDEYCPPDRRAGQECGPFFFCQQAATLEKLTRIMSPEQLRTRWGNPFSERDVARNYLIKSNISGVVQNYGQPTQQAKAVAATPITMSNSPNPARKLCLASCFLPLDAENSRWWKHFQDELAKQDMELVLLGTAPAADLEIRTIVIPLWLQGYSQIYGKLADTAILEVPLLQALAQRDQTWTKQGNRPLSEFTAGAADCQQVLRTLLDELQPSVVLVWGTILPQSVILQQLAQQKGLPCWVIERGLLPDTLMIEMVGQVGQSELNWSFTLNQALKATNETALFHAAQKSYLARCETKYAQAEFLDAPAFAAKFNPQGKKLVAALLQYDPASSFVPADYAGARIHTTGFASSAAAIQHLAAAAAQQDCLVIVKPHPMDEDDYSALETAHLRVIREVNLHSLIRAADVVACMASSTQFEALLYEKPLLLLARSPLANKGVAYEPRTADELPTVLKAALERRNFSKKLQAGRRFIHFLLQRFSIALKDHSHATPQLSDLATFVAQNAINVPDNRDINTRLEAVGKWLTLWENNPKRFVSGEIISVTSGNASPRKRLGMGDRQIELFSVTNQQDFQKIHQEEFSPRLAAQQRLNPGTGHPFVLKGFCAVCGGERSLTTDFMFTQPDVNGQWRPCWRERQVCTCGLNCRQRSCFHLLTDLLQLPESALLYCTEEQSELFQHIRHRFPLAIGSEFLGDQFPLGSTNPAGVHNEDITRLTFPDDSFDAVFSIDVLEHVPDYRAGLAELARCLKPGGKMLLTAPFNFGLAQTVIRAGFDSEGKLVHHLPPVYHGDPLSAEGCLCFNDFGWDLLDQVRDAGFENVVINVFTSEEFGYIGFQYVITATRKALLTQRSNRRTRICRNAAKSASTSHPRTPDLRAEAAEILEARAKELMSQTNWEEAALYYQQLTTRQPDNLEAWRGRITCCRNQGHAIMADILTEEALERHAEWAGTLTDTTGKNREEFLMVEGRTL